MANESGIELPILAYQGAGRVWSQKRERNENIFRKQYFRTVGYTDALLEASNIKLLLNWCVRMEQVAWQKEMKIAEYEAVKRAVSEFMGYMESDGEFEVFYDKQQEELMYRKNDWVLPVMELSAGYQSLIWMVFDIAYRMAVINPCKKDKIAETGGIVLIDEIDMHLHPRWQWNIIDALRKVFPNVQFVAATHAPILFASAKDVWVIDVDEQEIKYEYSHYGIDLNTSIKVYQETQNVSGAVQKQIEEFQNAMDEERYEDAKQVLELLEDRLTDAECLNYRNMLGTCLGHKEGTKGKDDICDTHKKYELITVNPQDRATVCQIKYRSATGEIYSDNEKIFKDLDKTLNLNCEKHLLKENRRAVLNSVIQELGKIKRSGLWSRKVLEAMKAKYENIDADGKKKEYAGIVVWYLDKKLKNV